MSDDEIEYIGFRPQAPPADPAPLPQAEPPKRGSFCPIRDGPCMQEACRFWGCFWATELDATRNEFYQMEVEGCTFGRKVSGADLEEAFPPEVAP